MDANVKSLQREFGDRSEPRTGLTEMDVVGCNPKPGLNRLRPADQRGRLIEQFWQIMVMISWYHGRFLKLFSVKINQKFENDV